MDRLTEIGSQLSQITLYDIKSYYNQAKNMVLNVSEMEAKVQEATNDEPWGASSTLMQEIAQGTFNFQQFNEIMPCIYSRFMEKEARQWREIYKALQLLEYIIKHGSERVVDDARSHLSTIKMLRNFHYIDDKGKDQGINVRNRANEITSLLMDLDKVRAERRKAKTNRSKYVGTGNDNLGFGGGGRYGGFGSDSLYSGSGGYGGGSSDYYGGASSSGFRDDSRQREEYNPDDYDNTRVSSARSPTSPTPRASASVAASSSVSKPEPKEKEKEKAVPVDDLLGDWGNDPNPASSSANQNKALPSVNNFLDASGDDDFDAFQSAPTSPPTSAVPPVFSSVPAAATQNTAAAKQDIFGMLNQPKPIPAAAPVLSQAVPAIQPTRPNYFSGSQPTPSTGLGMSIASPGSTRPNTSSVSSSSHMSAKSSSNFDDLWSLSLANTGKPATGSGASGGGKSIKDLEREKAQAAIWGGASHNQSQSLGNLGAFSGGTKTTTGGGSGAASSGTDDLLL